MEVVEQGEVKRLEATRLFNDALQLEGRWKEACTHPALKRTIIAQASHSTTLKGRWEDFSGDTTLSAEQFGVLASLCVKGAVTNEAQMKGFKLQVEDLLQRKYHQKFEEPLLNSQAIEFNGEEDLNFFRATLFVLEEEVGYSFASMAPNYFQSVLAKINLSLSVIRCNQIPVEEVISRFMKFISGGLVEKIFENIEVGNAYDPAESLKCLCYLYQSLRLTPLREKLQMTPLFKVNSWMVLVRLFKTSDMEIVYLISKQIPLFNKFLLEQGAVQQFAYETNLQLEYILEIYIGVVKSYRAIEAKPLNYRNDIVYIYNFSINSLVSFGDTPLSIVALRLISEVVKTGDFPLSQLSQLDLVLKVFVSSDANLISATLHILEASLKNRQMEIAQLFLMDRLFINFLQNSLKPSQPYDLKYSILEILFVLADNPKYFIKNDLMSLLTPLVFSPLETPTIVSSIILKIAESSLNSISMIMSLHESNIFEMLTILLQKCLIQQEAAINLHKLILMDVFRTLHCLSVGFEQKYSSAQVPGLHIFLRASLQGIDRLLQAINLLFAFDKASLFFETVLLSKCSVASKESGKVRFYEVVNGVLQQVMYNFPEGACQYRVRAVQVRKIVNARFYSLLKPSDLLLASIPVNIELSLKLGGNSLTRIIPYQYDFEDVKLLIRNYCVIVFKITPKDWENVRVFMSWRSNQRKEIKSTSSYAAVLESLIKNYMETAFRLQVEVELSVQEESHSEMVESYNSHAYETKKDRPRSPRFNQTYNQKNHYRTDTSGQKRMKQRSNSPHFGTQGFKTSYHR